MDDFRDQIDAAGERRRQALAMADSALNDVADLVPEALASGLTKRDIAELAGVSPLTLDAVLRRRAHEARSRLRLPSTPRELERALHRAA
jgi:hypothetical protein